MCSEWAVLCYFLGYARAKFYSIVPLSIVQPDDMWNPWVVQLFWYTWPLTLTWKPSSNPHGNLPACLIISAIIAIKCQSSQLVFGRRSHTFYTLAPTENIICVQSENKPGFFYIYIYTVHDVDAGLCFKDHFPPPPTVPTALRHKIGWWLMTFGQAAASARSFLLKYSDSDRNQSRKCSPAPWQSNINLHLIYK